MCHLEGLGCAQIRVLQLTVFSGADRVGIFASASSASSAFASAVFVSKGLALMEVRTVALPSPLFASAPSAFASAAEFCVRKGKSAKSLSLQDFLIWADDADAKLPAYSGGETTSMRINRVRAWPSRSKLISMPILRRKGAARRNRPARARGVSGHPREWVPA